MGWKTAETRFDSLRVHKIFSPLLCSDGLRGPTQPPIQWVKEPHSPGKSIRGVKLCTSSSVQVKSEWIYMSTPRYSLLVTTGITLLLFRL